MTENVKRMADVLRSGATMLSETCHRCSSPLFKLPTNEIFCVNCNRKILIVKDEAAAVKAVSPSVLTAVEETILTKIKDANDSLREEKDVTNLGNLTVLISNYIEVLDRIRRMRAEFG